MHESLRLYDVSLSILEQEIQALDNEDEELLTELCGKRAALMEEAWEKRAGCPADLLLERLKMIQEVQGTLAAKARMQTETLRLDLQHNRKESTRLTAYGKALGHGQNMYMLRKEG